MSLLCEAYDCSSSSSSTSSSPNPSRSSSPPVSKKFILSSAAQKRRSAMKLAARKVKLAKITVRMVSWKAEVDREFDAILKERLEETQVLKKENEALRASQSTFADKCNALAESAKSVRMILLEQYGRPSQEVEDRSVPSDDDDLSSDLMD